jgi:glyoxylase-like metal-dependent hydrolase (beta-lactamase superfamily II)
MDDPDIIIESETTIEINNEDWEIFNSPGHSGEHITLYNRNRGILFSGDNVMNSINVWLGPPKSDLDLYEKSLLKMMNLEGLKLILPAHGSPILKPYDRLREIIEWRRKRTDDILEILKDSFPEGISIIEILEKLYPSDSRMKREFASGWVELTLQKLEKENKLTIDKENNFYEPHPDTDINK